MTTLPDHGDSRAVTLIVCIAVMWPLAAIAVGFRVWARHIKKARYVLNDYAIFIALVFGTALLGIVLAAVLKGGMGQHASQVPADQQIFMAKVMVAGQPLWALANTAIKISILHLYVSIFWTKSFRVISYAAMGLAICLAGVITLQAFLICRPLAFNWDQTIPGGKCGNISSVFMSDTIINFVLDLAIVILPIPSLWKLQMPLGKKLSVYFMFSIGIVIVFIVGYRIRSVLEFNESDITYTAVNYAVFNIFETTLGIINTCLPVLKPVIDKCGINNVLIWTSNSKNGTTGSKDRRSHRGWYDGGLNSDRDISHPNKVNKMDDRHYLLNELPGSENYIRVSVQQNPHPSYNNTKMSKLPTDKVRITKEWAVDSKAV